MYKITHIMDNEKVSLFKTDDEFIEFVRNIRDENGDTGMVIHNVESASNYISKYCDNLELDVIKPFIDDTLELAQEAFWQMVTTTHPEIKSGDFPPDEKHNFDLACKRAVEIWLKFNTKDVTIV